MTNRWMEWGNAELDRQFGLGGPEESMLFSFAVYKWLPKLLHQNSISTPATPTWISLGTITEGKIEV